MASLRFDRTARRRACSSSEPLTKLTADCQRALREYCICGVLVIVEVIDPSAESAGQNDRNLPIYSTLR